MPSTQQRLQAVLQKGNLTVADLARWFVAPYHTVGGWIKGGFEPRGAPQDVQHIMALLGLLEALIKTRSGLPVPKLSRVERGTYLKKLRKTTLP